YYDFFFSSRRRHTRWPRDWSSDVCSSDLLLRERGAYEANLFGENSAFLVAASIFPYFYALVGERNPKQVPKGGPRSEYSQLACDTFEVIRRDGPISKQKMREVLGGSISFVA